LRRDGAFGIYALQLLPRLKPVPSPEWSTIGPFDSLWTIWQHTNPADLAKAFATAYIPEDQVDLNGVYTNSDGKQLHWRQKGDSSVGLMNDLVISMSGRNGAGSFAMNYAVTYIHSDADRVAQIHLGADWFAIAWLNGERVPSNIGSKMRERSGNADFVTWYPHSGTLKLKKGINTLLLKINGGSLGSGLGCWITDDPGIQCTATPGG
jgi:hypothetical protein